jgi:hypothetical protein
VSPPGDRTINCTTTLASISVPGITFAYPNIATDDVGNIGNWTLIYNQGVEVWIAGRIYFAFSAYDSTHSYCDRTQIGWAHNMDGSNWNCFTATRDAAGVVAELAATVPTPSVSVSSKRSDSYYLELYPDPDPVVGGCSGAATLYGFEPGTCMTAPTPFDATYAAMAIQVNPIDNSFELTFFTDAQCAGATSVAYGQGSGCTEANYAHAPLVVWMPITAPCTVSTYFSDDDDCTGPVANEYGATPNACAAPWSSAGGVSESWIINGETWVHYEWNNITCTGLVSEEGGDLGQCENSMIVTCSSRLAAPKANVNAPTLPSLDALPTGAPKSASASYIEIYPSPSCTGVPSIYSFDPLVCLAAPAGFSSAFQSMMVRTNPLNNAYEVVFYEDDACANEATYFYGQGSQCTVANPLSIVVNTPIIAAYTVTQYVADDCTGAIVSQYGATPDQCASSFDPEGLAVRWSVDERQAFIFSTFADTQCDQQVGQVDGSVGYCMASMMLTPTPAAHAPSMQATRTMPAEPKHVGPKTTFGAGPNQLAIFVEADCDGEPSVYYFDSDVCWAPPSPLNETYQSMMMQIDIESSEYGLSLWANNAQCAGGADSFTYGQGTECQNSALAVPFIVSLPMESICTAYTYSERVHRLAGPTGGGTELILHHRPRNE